MLKSVTEFWKNKSIKLSDSFEVLITFKNGKEPTSLYNCTGFTIPKLEYEEEVLSYGNLAQVFQTPKYDSCKELTLEFTEMMDKSKNKTKEKQMVVLSKVFEYMGFDTKQLFANGGLQSNSATYHFDKIIPTVEIKILNNKLWRYKYKYHFGNLKIVNYSIYNLDYQTESPCKVTVNLAFETYYKQAIDEPVDYGETPVNKTVKPKEDTKPKEKEPDGKVDVSLEDINGDSNARKEDIEQNWKENINQSDLDMMKDEQLYDPAYSELMGLDLDSDEVEPELQTEMWKQSANESDLDMIRNPELAELEDLDLDDSSPESNPPVQETQVASNEHIGQQTGGDKGPQGPTSNPNPTKIDNVKTKENTEPKPELASKPQQKKEEKSEFSKSEIKEMAQRAADFDKKAGVKKGKTGTYYAAGLNAMGLNASDRNDFDAAYKQNM